MNLIITRSIENREFKTELKFISFGGINIDSTTEESLLIDYPLIFDTNNCSFTGKFNYADSLPIVDDTNGETITLSTIRQQIKVDSNFKITYSIKVSDILNTEIQTILNTPEKVCMAKCLLFENAIKAQLKTLLDGIKAKQSDFDKTVLNITI